MTPRFTDIWAYLSTTPLLGLTITLLAYNAGLWVNRKVHLSPLLNPTLVAVVLLSSVLAWTHTEYKTYFDGAQFVHFMLGPVTVALAVPLYGQLAKLKQMLIPILGTLVVGSATAVVSAIVIGRLLGASRETLISLGPKSVTMPIAMGLTEQAGGLPSLTAAMVMLTGISGAICGRYVLNVVGVRDWSARGFAVGLTSHGMGTARAFQVNEEAGAFSGLAMGLNGIATALLFPFLLWLLGMS